MTFSIITIPMRDPSIYAPIPAYPIPTPLTPHAHNLNQRLQQLGLPGLHLAAHPNNRNPNDPNNAFAPAAPEVRALPVRALLAPLTMLALRAILLLYFFSPSKRPLFGLLLSAWILYEAWGAIRVVLGHERENNRARIGGGGQQQQQQGANGPGANANANQGRQPVQAGAGAGGARQPHAHTHTNGRSSVNVVLDTIASMNIADEDAALDAPAARAPSHAHRLRTFVSLLLVTLYPAVWDRRRAMLRRREGRIRTEAGAREEPQPQASEAESAGAEGAEEELVVREARMASEVRERARVQLVAKHEQRPAWVRAYVERAALAEWVDDP